MGSVEQLGIILVHGIGDQNRLEHLAHTVDSFARRFAASFGEENVTVQYDPAINPDVWISLQKKYGIEGKNKLQPTASASILVRATEGSAGPKLYLINFHEVWWRDLGKKATILSTIKFWIWAISFCGTRGRFSHNKYIGFEEPQNYSSKRKAVGAYRIVLFIMTTVLFILLFPVHILMQLAAIFPFIAGLHLFRTGYVYMSSIQMYQEQRKVYGDRPDFFDQPRRFGIQRRMTETIVDVASAGYDRWYIFAHSLGSIIAFKALNCSDVSLARLLRANYWFHPGLSALRGTMEFRPDPDEPKCPIWLGHDNALNSTALFSRLRGLITYGSPLEIFAHTWPALVFERTRRISEKFEWINLYDPVDVISSSVGSLGKWNPVTNFPCKVRNWIFSAHTDYLRTRQNQNLLIDATINWLLNPDQNFESCAEAESCARLNTMGLVWRRAILLVQCFMLIIAGCIIWPFAAQVITRPLGAMLAYTYDLFEVEEFPNPFAIATKSLQRSTINAHPESFLNVLYVAAAVGIAILTFSVIRRILNLIRSYVAPRIFPGRNRDYEQSS